MKQYIINSNLRKSLIKSQYKKHPKWKKRTWLRVMLYTLNIIVPLIIGYFLYTNANKSTPDWFIEQVGLTAIGSGILFMVFPIGYYKNLHVSCNDIVDFKENEILILYPDKVQNGYKPADTKFDDIYHINEIKYSDISNIVFNTYHNRIDLYGNIKWTIYTDYKENKIGSSKTYKNDRRRFYLYYDNNEDFIKTLENYTGIKREIRNYPEY